VAGVAPAPARAALKFSLSFFGKYEAEFRRDKYDLLFDSCEWADARGFEAVWLPERHFHAFGGLSPNPSVLAAALARKTQSLRLRAGSVVLPLHNPIRVAEEWAMVDNLSGGRVGVAFASGWHPDDFALAPEKYGKHRDITFRDAEVVRRLWRGEAVSVIGGAGNAIDVRLHPMPAQPELPTWLTVVNNPDTYATAGQLGLGILTNLMGQTHVDLARNIALYRAALQQHGWPPEQGHVTALLHSFVASSADVARETARRPFGEYLESSIGLFRNLMKSEKLSVDFNDLTADDRKVLCDKAFERYLDSAILVGSPDSCEKVARSLHGLGVDEIAAFIDFGVDDKTVVSNLGHLSELRQQCQRQPELTGGRRRVPEVSSTRTL
jgi:natural product biosynthesis luciferase-like monooxygenase protein